MRLLKDFYFFGEAEAVYSYSKNSQESSNVFNISQQISNRGGISFVPGISYALCRKMYIELMMPNLLAISYFHSRSDGAEGTPAVSNKGKASSFSVAANFNSNLLTNFGMGFKFLLGK